MAGLADVCEAMRIVDVIITTPPDNRISLAMGNAFAFQWEFEDGLSPVFKDVVSLIYPNKDKEFFFKDRGIVFAPILKISSSWDTLSRSSAEELFPLIVSTEQLRKRVDELLVLNMKISPNE